LNPLEKGGIEMFKRKCLYNSMKNKVTDKVNDGNGIDIGSIRERGRLI